MLYLKNNDNKKSTWRHHYFTPVYETSWWYDLFLRYRVRLKFVIMGPFLPFYLPLKIKKIRHLEIQKKCWRYHHFTNLYWKPQSYEVWFLRYRVTQTELFVILGQFCPFTPLKTQKTIWRCHYFKYVFQKSQSYMYASWDMECKRQSFAILHHFLLFYPTIDPKN